MPWSKSVRARVRLATNTSYVKIMFFFFGFLFNHFVCNLQKLEQQQAREAATWVVLQHQKSHKIVCTAFSLLLALVASAPVRRPLSAFWPCLTWSESRKIEEAWGSFVSDPPLPPFARQRLLRRLHYKTNDYVGRAISKERVETSRIDALEQSEITN